MGAFNSQYLGMGYGASAALGVILGAVYMLHMAARVIFGPLKFPGDGSDKGHAPHDHADEPHGLSVDLNGREIGILVPLALAVVMLGVCPNLIISPIRGPLERIMNVHRMSVHKDNSTGIASAPPAASLEEPL
jgi:NADH-quinone oxidoreductase subunit M